MSDLLLRIIAIRLAALVVAGLLLRALPEPHHAASDVPAAPQQRHAAAQTSAAVLALRDMRLHD